MFLRWWRMDGEGRRRVWRLYGWFSGLMLCGSCCGAVAWGAGMQVLVLKINNTGPASILHSSTSLTKAYFYFSFAQALRWAAAFLVTYALEFLCLSVAKLMVLNRMSDFAAPKGDGMSRRWVVWGRVVMAAVVAINVVGLVGSVAAAVKFERSAESFSAASAAYAANNTADADNLASLGFQQKQLALSAEAVQLICEIAVLLLIIIAFAVVGAACARRVSSALVDMPDAFAASGRQLRLQIVGTAAFVFATFLLRAVYSTMFALANALQDDGTNCPSNNVCDASCYNVYELMRMWLLNTPEFQVTVVLISSPLALLVALWGMTSKHTLQLMQSNRRQMNTMGDSMLRGTESG